MSLKKVSRWSEHEQVTQTEEGRLRRRVQRGMLKPHLVTKRWKWRESRQKSTSWVLTYPAVICSEKRQRGTWKHITVPFLYENNVCFGLKVKPGTSYSKLSVNLLEAAASYYQLVSLKIGSREMASWQFYMIAIWIFHRTFLHLCKFFRLSHWAWTKWKTICILAILEIFSLLKFICHQMTNGLTGGSTQHSDQTENH